MPAYVPTTWADSPATSSPLSAANMNHIETGIKALSDSIDDAWTTTTASVIASGGGTLGTTSSSLTYKVLESILFFRLTVTITTVGTGTGAVTITMPMAAVGEHILPGRENVLTGSSIVGRISNASIALTTLTYNNASWIGATAQLTMSGSYRVA